MKNIRVVRFEREALLTPPALSPDALRTPHPAAAEVVQKLRFLGYGVEIAGGDNVLSAATGGAGTVATADILFVSPNLKGAGNAALKAGMRLAWLAPAATIHPAGNAFVLRELADLPERLREAETESLRREKPSRDARNLLALLRGVPDEGPWPQGRKHEEDERGVGDLILEIAAKLGRNEHPLRALRGRWLEIIGNAKLAGVCEPHDITTGGALRVHCPNAIVRTEMQWLVPKILAAVTGIRGCEKIKKVSFHV
ncbi:MAG: DUF721 domain-containing protein [Puniceicoccales bacterium]|nr:DUF721 domain-containing protein [Puniceicoccales bacterium]